jgi:hypothetical protein
MRPLRLGDGVTHRSPVTHWAGKVIALDGARAQVIWQPFDQTVWESVDGLVGPHNTGRITP